VGVLYVRRDTPLVPLIHGGDQERQRRAGTENVGGIVACGAALELVERHRAAIASRLTALRDRLIEGIEATVPGAHDLLIHPPEPLVPSPMTRSGVSIGAGSWTVTAVYSPPGPTPSSVGTRQTIMANPLLMDRMFQRIMRGLVGTGRAPHYAELARTLGLEVERGASSSATSAARRPRTGTGDPGPPKSRLHARTGGRCKGPLGAAMSGPEPRRAGFVRECSLMLDRVPLRSADDIRGRLVQQEQRLLEVVQYGPVLVH
jgi:Aminotransferase class-V